MNSKKHLCRLFAGVIAATISMNSIVLGADSINIPSAVAYQPLTTQQKLEDIDFFCTQLEKLHPDMYRNVKKDVFQLQRQKLENKVSGLSDIEFAYELQLLAALIKDAHTIVGMSELAKEQLFFPIQLKKMEGKWIVLAITPANESQLGKEVIAIDGIPIEDVVEQLSLFVSYENEIRRDRQLRNVFMNSDLLHYLGATKYEDKAIFTVQDTQGKTEDISITAVKEQKDIVALSSQIEKRPVTYVDKKKLYFTLDLQPNVLYIQYNSCRQDENLPMEEFVSQIAKKIENNNYEKVIIDLRNNSGGSDGVLIPLIEKLVELKKSKPFETYGLIGEATFSSAVINSVMLKEAGFTLVGTPTGNNANHFGAVRDFELPNLAVYVAYSTKYIDLTEYFSTAKAYENGPVTPDIYIEETMKDYLSGKDTVVETVLKQ